MSETDGPIDIEVTPEGGYPIWFKYGWICGRQKTPSVGIEFSGPFPQGRKSSGGSVFTTEQVIALRDYFIAAAKAMIKEKCKGKNDNP